MKGFGRWMGEVLAMSLLLAIGAWLLEPRWSYGDVVGLFLVVRAALL